MYVNQKDNKKLSKVLSTKLSIDDYDAFQMLTKLEYQAGLIREESTSELLRFRIHHILNQVRNQPEYQILKQQQEKQVQNNQQQQQLHSQVILLPTTIAASHQRHIPKDISNRNNLDGRKITPWKLSSSSLLSTQMNHHTFW
jgi:hypothetical protein